MKKIGIATLLVGLTVGYLNADTCEQYPYNDGMTVVDTPKGPKFLSTAYVGVDIDDVDEVMDATREAEMVAKTKISKFFNETIQSDESMEKAVDKEVTVIGDQKSINKKTVKNTLTKIRNSSSSLLRGVVKIGSCYTPAKEVRVTVGLKPETIKMAEDGQGAINSSLKRSEAQQNSNSNTNGKGGTSSNLNSMGGFSDTKQLSNF